VYFKGADLHELTRDEKISIVSAVDNSVGEAALVSILSYQLTASK
jgi:hypothetical protein